MEEDNEKVMKGFDDSVLRVFGEKNSLRNGGVLYRVPADSKHGYNFDYLLFIPNGFRYKTSLILESMNYRAGDTPNPDEKVEYMYENFKSFRSPIHLCNQNSLFPILYPLIPRFFDEDLGEEIYVNMLSSNSFRTNNKLYERVDRQIINMVLDAKVRLKQNGIQIGEKIIIHGFSASAKFANRFALLYPEIVKLVIAGGLAGVLILPLRKINDEKLLYPIGVGDLDEVTDKKIQQFRRLRQFYYQGRQDEIDAFESADGVSGPIPYYKGIINTAELRQLHKFLGEDIMTRWNKSQEVYAELCENVTFKTYEDGGHSLDAAMEDIKAMLESES